MLVEWDTVVRWNTAGWDDTAVVWDTVWSWDTVVCGATVVEIVCTKALGVVTGASVVLSEEGSSLEDSGRGWNESHWHFRTVEEGLPAFSVFPLSLSLRARISLSLVFLWCECNALSPIISLDRRWALRYSFSRFCALRQYQSKWKNNSDHFDRAMLSFKKSRCERENSHILFVPGKWIQWGAVSCQRGIRTRDGDSIERRLDSRRESARSELWMRRRFRLRRPGTNNYSSRG